MFRDIAGTELETAVRTATLHDTDTQVTSAQIQVQLGLEYARLIRWLGDVAPDMVTDYDDVTVAAGAFKIMKSSLIPTRVDAQYDKVVSIQRKESNVWTSINAASEAEDDWNMEYISFIERGDHFYLRPEANAPGAYRVTCLWGVSFDATVDPANSGTARKYYLIDGTQQALIHRVAAFVAHRHCDLDQVEYHRKVAEESLKEAKQFLRNRTGATPVMGLSRRRAW